MHMLFEDIQILKYITSMLPYYGIFFFNLFVLIILVD